jgi:hypothetical protein
MPAESGRVRPQIDDRVKDTTTNASHQLGLLRRRPLEMHAPDGALLPGLGEARLRDFRQQPVGGEFTLAMEAREETARIHHGLEVDANDAG